MDTNEMMVTIDGKQYVTIHAKCGDVEMPVVRRYARRARAGLKIGDGVTCTRDGVIVALVDVTRKFPETKSGVWIIERDVDVDVVVKSRDARADGTRFIVYIADNGDVNAVAALDGVRVWCSRTKSFVGE